MDAGSVPSLLGQAENQESQGGDGQNQGEVSGLRFGHDNRALRYPRDVPRVTAPLSGTLSADAWDLCSPIGGKGVRSVGRTGDTHTIRHCG